MKKKVGRQEVEGRKERKKERRRKDFEGMTEGRKLRDAEERKEGRKAGS